MGLGHFSLFPVISLFFSPSLWEAARYRLKNYLKEPLNPRRQTSKPTGKAKERERSEKENEDSSYANNRPHNMGQACKFN